MTDNLIELALAPTPLPPEIQEDLHIDITGKDKTRIAELKQEIDLEDTNSIIFFGTKAQEQLTELSDEMLAGVRTKDLGSAGNALTSMVGKLRSFDIGSLGQKPGFIARLLGKNPIKKFLNQYEEVSGQVDTIGDDLERHKNTLLTDIEKLDRLYDANLDYFHTLELYIAAGDERLKELDETVIPDYVKKAENVDDVLEAQKLRDIRTARDDLERRVHDLRLTRTVTMQSLPSIRLVQENDKSLVTKINSTIANTLPLWRQQLAYAVTIYRSGEAAKSVKSASDLTNELLKTNSENLRTANKTVREEMERGVVDIETIKQANENLIATIEDSLKIAEDGKQKRREAEGHLIECEQNLKETLRQAKVRAVEAGEQPQEDAA